MSRRTTWATLFHLYLVSPSACLNNSEMTPKYPSSFFVTFCSDHSISGCLAIKSQNDEACVLAQKSVHDCNFDPIYVNCGPI